VKELSPQRVTALPSEKGPKLQITK